jgi:hypothetical protein
LPYALPLILIRFWRPPKIWRMPTETSR